MLDVSRDLSASTYNVLPIVEDADAHVRAADLIEAMTKLAGPVFLRHQIEEEWGIGLLHHHWSLYDDEVPGEYVSRSQNMVEYIMRPIPKAEDGAYVPCLLSAISGTTSKVRFQALEFSSDPQAVCSYRRLENLPSFLTDLHGVLIEGGLATHFGLTSIKNVSMPGVRLVEFTQPHRASIVREVDEHSIDWTRIVQTCWSFSRDTEGMACKRDCFKTCTLPKDGGAHYSTHNALHNPNG